MMKILFVCLGNICRSPMAEYIFRDMVKKQGLETKVACASAAVSNEELGNPVYPPAKRKLLSLGIRCDDKRARQISKRDYGDYDLLIGMENRHLMQMRRVFGGDPEGKIHLLLGFTSSPRDIDDPWYTDDFDTACREIQEGCEALLAWLKNQYRWEA